MLGENVLKLLWSLWDVQSWHMPPVQLVIIWHLRRNYCFWVQEGKLICRCMSYCCECSGPLNFTIINIHQFMTEFKVNCFSIWNKCSLNALISCLDVLYSIQEMKIIFMVIWPFKKTRQSIIVDLFFLNSFMNTGFIL